MPIGLPQFVEFMCWKWGIEALPFEYRDKSGADRPRLKGILYLDASGQAVMPRVCAYLPVEFEPTPTDRVHRLSHQWVSLAKGLAFDLKKRGVKGVLSLPPTVEDARPWAWAGFRTLVAYTLWIDFPWKLDHASYSVRKQVAKAGRAGYTSERSDDIEALVRCLAGTEGRQGISYRMSVADLERARALLGPDHLRIYLCRSPSGEPASGRAILHAPGRRAVDWLAGTDPSHLTSGATQHLVAFALDDLQMAGAAGFDFAGANVERVASAKMEFGARLVPFYQIEPISARMLAVTAMKWLINKWSLV